MLVGYLKSLDGFVPVNYIDGNYAHMGATISDAILQAGTNYDRVVRPRIKTIRDVYPEATTTSAFRRLLMEKGSKTVLSWKDDEKPNRVVALTEFFLSEGIETEEGLRKWMTCESHRCRLLKIRGIGPKTVDYIKILVGLQTVAVDRHVVTLLREAGIPASGYEEAQEILNLSADLLEMKRAFFDHSIWQYMSRRKPRNKKCCSQPRHPNRRSLRTRRSFREGYDNL
jgi:endonuclease III